MYLFMWVIKKNVKIFKNMEQHKKFVIATELPLLFLKSKLLPPPLSTESLFSCRGL